ncbi:MAG: hypothetical protein KatS3mg081_2503 [Gemmatimonadales bacterium]|nr:hypothetical protein HRbin33_01540 [bacterium HR33]GIW53148.1 MAG: hypothetical protein KatS3mg081_2503 [Gemmatimonadales bacterium]
MVPAPASGQGHGPVFALSTPTLAQGGWSIDVTSMGRVAGSDAIVMLRPMASYGITEDLQLSLSLPMPLYRSQGLRPERAASRMPANPDVELMLAWRFHRRGTAVGSRFESTAYLAFAYPTDDRRAGLPTSPGIVAALVTGYASRTVYLWAGGLYRRYMTPAGPGTDHPGDLLMHTVALGYRPPPFQHDFPRPDWRLFVEVVGEYTRRDVVAGAAREESGGYQLFAGPTVLGLYGRWGVAGGPLLPVWRSLNGTQRGDDVRWVVNFIAWF